MNARALVLLFALLALSCGEPDEPINPVACVSDAECPGTQVCFPDGCGDPGKDIAVEVTPSAASGNHAQDFQVFELSATQNLEVFGPTRLGGDVRRIPAAALTNDPALAEPYSKEVRFQITGESALIPGLARTYDARVTPSVGVFSVPIGAGRFQVTALAEDRAIPPVRLSDLVVQAGDAARIEVLFSGASTLLRLDGRLVRSPGLPFTNAKMQIQALDELTGAPLSQRVEVSSGTPTSSGDFVLFLDPAAKEAERFLLLASPVDLVDSIPQKVFTARLGEPLPELSFGDYGNLVPASGKLVAFDGRPIDNAAVYVEGRVAGGGTFRSAVTTTDAGVFSLQTFPSSPESPFVLVAVPSSDSSAGIARVSAPVAASGGDLGTFTAPRKIPVSGQLVRPDGLPAKGVTVVAEPIAALEATPLPSNRTTTTSDGNGAFVLNLDPARYRLDFLPGADLPRVSRFVTVRRDAPETGESADTPALSLPPFTLSKGRTVGGTVSIRATAQTGTRQAAPYASVRFFRVVTVEGKKSSVLLAESIADAVGGYSVTLPTR